MLLIFFCIERIKFFAIGTLMAMLIDEEKSDAEFESDREDDLAEDDSEIEEDQGPDQEVIIADAVHQEDKITVSDPTAIAAIYEKSFFGYHDGAKYTRIGDFGSTFVIRTQTSSIIHRRSSNDDL